MSLFKLIIYSWRPRYLWAALVVASLGFWLLVAQSLSLDPVRLADLKPSDCYRRISKTDLDPQEWNSFLLCFQDPELGRTRDRFVNLCVLDFVIGRVPNYILLPALLAGYGGYSLDFLYRRLRKARTEHKLNEKHG
jgi:hypothetical protein